MVKRRIILENKHKRKQYFRIAEYEDHIRLERYLSTDIVEVDIQGMVDGKPVTMVGDACFFHHSEIGEITFPETLNVIENNAFAFCSGIRKLVLPDSIYDIGTGAFQDCKGLEKVILPVGLERIRALVFGYCHFSADIRLVLPENLKVIEAGAFYMAGAFELTLPDSVAEIGRGAFCWGPHVTSALPYDQGWYMDWPYGEKIITTKGREGIVSEFRYVEQGCMILSLNMEDSSKGILFYPSVSENGYTFVSESSQKIMEEDRFRTPYASQIYKAWLRGII